MNVIARIPCPLAGPSHLVTASEVATLEFAREVLKLPVPQVLTWSGANRDRTNGVGADFIIMEEVRGVPLGNRWRDFQSADEVRPAVLGILELEKKFESLRFSRIGSLYFKEDVGADLGYTPLLVGDVDDATLRLSEKYRIGPLIDYQWWRGDRAHIGLDRGPCMIIAFIPEIRFLILIPTGSDASSFFLAAAKNEQTVLAQQSAHLGRYRRKPTHDSATHSKLLSMYKAAVPHIVPTTNDDICAPTLWHPDLTLNNIFVSESGPGNIQGIIDWQHAAVLPYFMFASIPPALIYEGHRIDMNQLVPKLPPDFEELSVEEQAECRLHLRFANRQRLYEAKVDSNPRRRLAGSLPHLEELMMLPTYVSRAWADGVFDLQEALVRLRDNWTAIAGPNTPCPIEFSSQEMTEHEQRLERFRCYEAAITAIYSGLHCEGDGWVAHENYDAVRRMIDSLEASWDEEIAGSPFPFKDGEYSFFLS